MPAARITATMGTADTTSARAAGRMKTAMTPGTATGPSGTLSLESLPILARRLAKGGIEVDDYGARKAALARIEVIASRCRRSLRARATVHTSSERLAHTFTRRMK